MVGPVLAFRGELEAAMQLGVPQVGVHQEHPVSFLRKGERESHGGVGLALLATAGSDRECLRRAEALDRLEPRADRTVDVEVLGAGGQVRRQGGGNQQPAQGLEVRVRAQAAVEAVPNPVSLADIKSDPRLSELSLLKQSRLSVMPIDAKSWKIICGMGGVKT